MSGQSSENVSQNNLKSNTSQLSGNPYVKNQAKMQQKIEVKEPFQSEEAKALDCVYREVGIPSNQLGMTLVHTRQKLQPFIDEGFVNEDRKHKTAKDKMKKPVILKVKKTDCNLDYAIYEYRLRIREHIKNTEIHELDYLLKRLS